jgi:glycosyltransferase involved in cell wall biosynthesis
LLGLKALGLPVVTTVHHPLTVDRRASFVRDNNITEAVGSMQFYPIGMQSFVARRVDRVLTSSECSADQITQDFGVPRNQISNVSNGLDTDLYCPDPSVEKSATDILCVGRASDPNKGIRTLIEALGKTPKHITMTLVDNNHPDNELFKWARDAGVIDRVRITGRLPLEDLIRHYRSAALVAVPSRYEGFGLPAVEAMACGTPVVACAAGALREVMQHTGGGVTVPIDNPDALAHAITELMSQPDRRRSLAEAGRARVNEIYSWSHIAKRTAEVYAEVIGARRGRPTTMITSAKTGAKRATASNT